MAGLVLHNICLMRHIPVPDNANGDSECRSVKESEEGGQEGERSTGKTERLDDVIPYHLHQQVII